MRDYLYLPRSLMALAVILTEQGFQPHEWQVRFSSVAGQLRPYLIRFRHSRNQEFFVAAQEMLLTDMGDLVGLSNADVSAAVKNRYLKTDKQVNILLIV